MGCGASKKADAATPAAEGTSGAPAAAAAAPVAAAAPTVMSDDYPPKAVASHLKDLPEWIKLGCGNAEYFCEEKGAVFPGDKCPDELPDLSEHNNLAANALRENPEIYEKYKNVTTPGGVSLAKCIKTGIDNKGHPHIMTCGLVAGDEDCFTTFKDLFDIVVGKRNGDYAPDAVHTTDMDISKLSTTKIDPDGKYVLTTRCRTGRSVKGLPLPPACSFEQRRETERVVVNALNKLKGELKGKYFPLCGSRSMPGAMDTEKEEKLRKNGNLFQEPDSTLLLSSGCGRHWPDARGIFHNDKENFFVWVNEEDQMRIVSMEKGDNIRAIFRRFANATKAVQESLEGDGYGIMHNEHLGYILTCPSNLGTGLRAGAMVTVPLFSARPDFKDILKKMRLQARGTAGVDSASTGGTWDISNSDRLGMSEIQLCNLFIEGVAQIIRWEKKLEAGEDIEAEVSEACPMGLGEVPTMPDEGEVSVEDAPAATGDDYPPNAVASHLKNLPEWIKLGCGNAEYFCEEKGAVFPGDKCPDELPDLSEHNNLAANALRENPEIYEKYKNVTTPGGVSLAKCIKTGIDNKGHPHIMTCGLVAGDEDCFTTFKDLFDIVIGKRNGDYAPDAVHTTDMDISKLSETKIDPTGKYVLTTRCRTGRSVKGLPLPPACSFEQRRETERVVVNALNKLDGELKGQYFPLCGSRSMAGAMDEEKEEKLRKNGNLFQEPDSTLLLSSGCGRHWPDARGIFHNDAENFFVWVNEEDQMRIVSMEKGDNIRAIFQRFCDATKAVQESLEGDGYGIMHSEHLGYILTCPSNLGTGLRAGCMVVVPLFSARPDFKDILKKMRLQARGTAGVDSASTGGTWDISNSDRLGMSEIQLCNLFIEGVAQIIKWEQMLEAGEDIEAEVADAKPMGI